MFSIQQRLGDMQRNKCDIFRKKIKQSIEIVTKGSQMLDLANTSKKLLNMFKLHETMFI